MDADTAPQILTSIMNSLGSAQACFDFAPLMKAQGPVDCIDVKAKGPTRSQLALSAIIAQTTRPNYTYIHQWILVIVTS